MNKYRPLILPVLVVSLYIVFLIIVRQLLPSSKDFVSHLSSLYGHYGYEIVFLGSILEALVIVNFFVPGVAAMGLGAVFARLGELDLTLVILTATAGTMIGYAVDFTLGFWGFSEIMEKSAFGESLGRIRNRLQKSRVLGLSLGFIHPNIGALTAIAAGTLKMNFIQFLLLALLSTLAWYSLWGIMVFVLGEIFLTILTKYAFVLILFALSVWILSILYGKYKRV